MPVKIDQIESEVTASGAAAPAGVSGTPAQQREWEHLDRLRLAMRRLQLDRLRTAAEGFDD